MTETDSTSSGQEEYAGGYSQACIYVKAHKITKTCTTTEENEPLVTGTTATVPLLLPDPDELALWEEQSVVTQLQEGCGCTLSHSQMECCRQFTVEHVLEVREWCQELTRADLDMAVMGQLHAFVMIGDETIRTAR